MCVCCCWWIGWYVLFDLVCVNFCVGCLCICVYVGVCIFVVVVGEGNGCYVVEEVCGCVGIVVLFFVWCCCIEVCVVVFEYYWLVVVLYCVVWYLFCVCVLFWWVVGVCVVVVEWICGVKCYVVICVEVGYCIVGVVVWYVCVEWVEFVDVGVDDVCVL